MEPKQHWNNIYQTKDPTELSWFQPSLTKSLAMIESAKVGADAEIIDVGGGASTLVDDLLARGFQHLTVLDISEQALDRTRQRLGSRADEVN
ncbi:MAG: hypothetical protein ABIZ95_03125 [Pyrinomonadaceae bacterium]